MVWWYSLFPEDHPHHGVRCDLCQCDKGILEFLLTLLLLELVGDGPHSLVILAEPVKQVLDFKLVLSAH